MPAPGLVTNYNVQQIFLGENWYEDKNFTNGTGSPIVIAPGTVLGTILASNTWALMQSTNTDGSEIPKAIFYNENFSYTVPANSTVLISGCTKGYVNQNALTFANGTDTINTPLKADTTGGITVQDAIRQIGILLVPSIELSVTDPNQ